MRQIQFNDVSENAQLGDRVFLQKQEQEVVRCQETGVPMLNIDADRLAPGDLSFIKKLGLTISNPETEEPVALGVEVKRKSCGCCLSEWLDSDDDDDSSFFLPTPLSSGSIFGGFGGGLFGGGGAARRF